MQVILLERVEKLGELGDAVHVKAGYGRNYLLPQGKAIRANPENLKKFEAEKAERLQQNDAKRAAAEAMKADLHEKLVVVIRAASEAGHLYGSVTSRDVSNAIKDSLGVDIDRSMIVMTGASKMLGIFDFTVRLHPEVSAVVKVNIAQSVEEAGLQADRVAKGLPALLIGDGDDDGRGGRDSRSKATAAAEAALLQAAKESAGGAVEVKPEGEEEAEAEAEKSDEPEAEVKAEEPEKTEE